MQMLAKRRAKRAGNAAGKKRAVLYVSLFIVALVGILAGRFFLQWNEDRQTERRVNQKMDSVLGH